MADYTEYDTPGYTGGADNTPGGNDGGATSDPFVDQLTALYRKYGRGDPTPAEIAAHRGNPGGLTAIEALLKADNGKQTETGGTTTEPPPDTTTGPGGPTAPPSGGLLDPFAKTYTTPPPVDLGGPKGIEYIPPTPTFTPPGYTKPPAFTFEDYQPIGAFKAPTAAEALNEQGYQFRVGQGQDRLEHGAAAKGVLNSGGTLQDTLDYGQNAASQEYQNVWGRQYNTWQANDAASRANYAMRRGNAVDTYNTNYGTQFVDPYKFTYQGAMDSFAPQMVGYSTQASAGQHQNDVNTTNAWGQYLFDWQKWQDQRDSTFSKMFNYANA